MEVRAWVTAWYRKQDWPRWCAICDFKGSYDEWLVRAEAGTKEQERVGYHVAKVVIEPEKFLDWSKANGGVVGAEARTAYAITLFQESGADDDG